jgi:hypothetical protein
MRVRESYEERLRKTYPAVEQWYREKALRSRLTAGAQIRLLGRVCDWLKLTPPQLVEEVRKNPARFKSRMVAYAEELKARHVQDAYLVRAFSTLNSWLHANKVRKVPEDLFPKLAPVRVVHQEVIPTQEQLREALAHLSLRGQVEALFMAHTGARPGVLGHYDGTTGLTLGDLPELDLGALEFTKLPFRVVVPAHLSKNHASYTTFGSSELASSIIRYLQERRDKFHEKFTSASPLVSRARQVKFTGGGDFEGKRYEPGFISELNIAAELREALRAVFPVDTPRPYCLRSFFSSQMFVAENQHRVSATQRESWMGHTSGMDAVYNVRKGDHLVETMRKAYADCEEFLTTQTRSAKEVRTDRLLERLGARLGLGKDEALSVVEGLLAEEVKAERPQQTPKTTRSESRRAMMPGAEADTLIMDGWVVGPSKLSDGKLVLYAPGAQPGAN